MGVVSCGSPWIFIHGTDIVGGGLIVPFSVFFFASFRSYFLAPPPRKRLNSAIFRSFLLFFGLFFVVSPPGNFSADAFDCNKNCFALSKFVLEKKVFQTTSCLLN